SRVLNIKDEHGIVGLHLEMTFCGRGRAASSAAVTSILTNCGLGPWDNPGSDVPDPRDTSDDSLLAKAASSKKQSQEAARANLSTLLLDESLLPTQVGFENSVLSANLTACSA